MCAPPVTHVLSIHGLSHLSSNSALHTSGDCMLCMLVLLFFSLIYVFSALHRPACDLEINLSMPCWRTPQFLQGRKEDRQERRVAGGAIIKNAQVFSLLEYFYLQCIKKPHATQVEYVNNSRKRTLLNNQSFFIHTFLSADDQTVCPSLLMCD